MNFFVHIGLVNNLDMIRTSSGNMNVKAAAVRLPHIFDVITVLSQRIAGLTQRTINPHDLCLFMGGFESEVEQFKTLSPRFFFITCDILKLNDGFPQGDMGCVGIRTQLVVPVVLRGGYYYVIVGKGNTPVYRIHHPTQFFFSPKGKDFLTQMLVRSHCESKDCVLSPIFTPEGKHAFYCLPINLNTSCNGWPSELWDDLDEDVLNAMLPFEVVHEPVVSSNQKYSVQVLKLNDTTNIVDVMFPGSE